VGSSCWLSRRWKRDERTHGWLGVRWAVSKDSGWLGNRRVTYHPGHAPSHAASPRSSRSSSSRRRPVRGCVGPSGPQRRVANFRHRRERPSGLACSRRPGARGKARTSADGQPGLNDISACWPTRPTASLSTPRGRARTATVPCRRTRRDSKPSSIARGRAGTARTTRAGRT
jgi:hypothetical protein